MYILMYIHVYHTKGRTYILSVGKYFFYVHIFNHLLHLNNHCHYYLE